ncbi:hypothetical protein VaNZ11_007171 [Volvox africanus]|uniref:C2 domain-containing protein n=1 Tax=Volvox africanus TaxID=51714 RepID=A0ABQ5S3J6_9CHLO|nr:hypothetical protein VaNZ11_007171 [Volvox africanus]
MDEEQEEPKSNVTPGENGTDVVHSRQSVDPISGRIHRAPAATQISLAIDCPRLGLKLINKQCLSSTIVGLQGAKDKPAAASEVTKVPADVLAIMLEGIRFFMPDIYRIDLQAATVKISLLGGVSGGPKHVLIVPASHECADGHGTKLDFSTTDKSYIAKSSATAESLFHGAVQSWASEGAIYPDAPISRYLSRFKVHLAAVEIALSSPPFVVACARFMDSVMRLKAATQKAGVATPYEWPSTNLHLLVMDSYTRNRIKVPSSMAAFMPKLEFFCPLVSVRWMLAAAHTPSIGGISGQHSDVLAVAVASNFRIASRYVHTCYASLVQSTSARAHLEVYFQIQARSDSRLVTPGGTASGTCTPHLGHFAKLWLDADDVELAFPCSWALTLQGVTQQQELPIKRLKRGGSRAFYGTGAASAATSLPATLTGFSEATRAGRRHPQVSLPFLPVLKIRSFSALALNQVPYAPAVPGTMTTHHTVAMHSAIAWFSPWHALALNAAIDSILTHPVLVNLKSQKEQSYNGSQAGAAPTNGLPLASKPSPHHTSQTGSAAADGSSISVLLDIPLLAINCYAEMPKAFGAMGDLESKLQAMQNSGSALQLASWVTKRLATNEPKELNLGTDLLLRWGLRLTPLLTVNIANIRSGLRLTRRNYVMAKLQTTGLQVSDHQARLKRSLYAKVWLANSGKGSDGPAVHSVQGLMPEDNTSQLLGPLSTRAAALRDFVRNRRRAALCLPSYLAPHGEKRGQMRQQWLRLLEIQLLHRASDFAMFLLSPTHRSVAQCIGALPQPLESYRLLFQESIKYASPHSGSPAVLVAPLEPVMVSPHRSSAVDFIAHSISQSEPPVQRSSRHFRKVSALGSIASLFSPGPSRASYDTTTNRTSVTLAQMLGAVHSQSFRHVATLRHSVTMLSGRGSATDSSPLALREDGGAYARSSRGRILEETCTPTSSMLPARETGSGSSQPADVLDSPADVPCPLSKGPPVPVINSESVRLGHSRKIQSGDITESEGPEAASSLHSAFTTAQEQSTAAAQDSMLDTQPLMAASGTKLSFVQAFRYLRVGLTRQKHLAFVYNMPLPTPVLAIVMTQGIASRDSTTISAECQQVISSVGVHSVGAILRMLVQTEEAVRSSVRTGRQSMDTGSTSRINASSSPALSGYEVTLNVAILRIKVVVEEPPRRLLSRRPLSSIPESDMSQHGRERKSLDPVDKEKREPGLTELTLLQLNELSVELLPDSQSSGSAGLHVKAGIQDIIVLDLQGCVEHRNVLIRKVEQLGDPAFRTRRSPPQVKVECCLPSERDAPGVFKVRVLDLNITWLRRYSNNLLYAVGIMTAAYRSAVHEGAAVNAAVASSTVQPLSEQTAASSLSATSSSRAAPPIILIEAINLKVVLPGGAAASHGPIRRAVHNEALSLETTSVALCIPGDIFGLRDTKLVNFEHLDGFPAWMTSPDEVYELIVSSLRLGDKHFPQINQQLKPDDTVQPRGSGDQQGESDAMARHHQTPAAANTSSPSNRLQKRLQAAKATLIDPLKEILHEAGHKRNKQRGELGVVLIDEAATTYQTRELNPGYLSIDDAESRPAMEGTSVAPHHHTTTTLHAATGPQGASKPPAPEAGASAKRQLQGTTSIPFSQPACKVEIDSSSTAGHRSQSASTPNLTDVNHEFQPLVLISVNGFIISCGKIVPYDCAYEHKQYMCETTEAKIGVQGTVLPPADLRYTAYDEKSRPRRKLVDCDPVVESVLNLLADTALQSVHQLIDPVNLKGAVFNHMQHGAVQVHFSALGPMVARLGPQHYERLMKVLTDNITEANSCFNVGATIANKMAQRRTTFSPNAAFVPPLGQLPYFHLTVEWMEQFRAVLESDPAWWKPGKAPSLDVEPCLEACFTKCSLGLIMMQKTHDLFFALYSQQLHIADVRINEHDSTRNPPEDHQGETLDVNPAIVHMRSDSSRRHSGGAISKSNATGSVYYDEENAGVWPLDGESTDTPDGQNVQPVVDDQLRHIFPGRPAVVTLLRSNLDLPTDESAHLTAGSTTSGEASGSGDCPHDSQHNCVRVSFAMLQDGTIANEIEMCHTLVQWPYLTETSLVSSIIAIFMPMWGHPLSGPEALLRLSATPWFYFNLLLRNSQVYLPLLAPHLRRLTYGWRAAAAEAAGENIHLTPEKLQKLFASTVDDDTARCPSHNTTSGSGERLRPLCQDEQPFMVQPPEPLPSTGRLGVRNKATVSPLGDPAVSSNFATLTMRQMPGVAICEEQPKRLEQMGVAITMAAFRLGHFSGGDGDSILKIDLCNSAGFVRHSNVQVTNWLLPIRSMALEHQCKMPMVGESQVLQKYIAAARKLMFQLRSVMRSKQATKRCSQQQIREIEAEPQLTDKSSFAGGNLQNEPEGVGMPSLGVNGDDLASVRSRAAHSAGATSALDLLVQQATFRAAGLLELHKLPLPTSSAALVAVEKLLSRQISESKIVFALDTAVVRASFSNIPVWHALLDDIGIAMGLMKQNNGLFSHAPTMNELAQPYIRTSASEAAAEMRATWKFRPSCISVDAKVKSLGFVLCDDKPKSYGAPDVLTMAMEQIAIVYSTARRYYDHMPEQSGCISLRLASQFLNNSTGRWEHLLEPWPAELHLSDSINPVFKSSRTKYIFVSSSELMKLTFHPSCLLTLGDTLSFVRRISDRQQVTIAPMGLSRGGTAAPVAEDPPSVEEQMALSGSIMTRVPQRYLIQNLTGLMMSYWAPKSEDDVQPASTKRVLPSGCSEELQVTPTAKQVKIVGPGGVVVTRLQAQVIVLNFEGSWMPITDVSVDVVGKYCYDLHSPTDERRAPVIVDVALVGRTKILKIHSALFVQNDTSCRLGFRLHFPSVLLARQVVQSAGDMQLPGEQDIQLRTLKPGEGRYLPIVAALGGALYLEARTPIGKGWCKYQAAQHDVIHLSPIVKEMTSQAGFITTGLPVTGQFGLYGNAPLHFAVKVLVRTRTEYSYATFHSMEVPGPGFFAKASRPLEASIKICPTVVLTNSLPYYMEGYIISLNYLSRDFDTYSARKVAGETAPFDGGALTAAKTSIASSPPAVESRRLMKFRRSETLAEEVQDAEDEERIVAEFNSLIKMLKLKAAKEFQLQKLKGYDKMQSKKNKCHMLAVLRCNLRWIAKRNSKEMDLLVRTDTEPPDRVTWQELDSFIEWAKQNIRLVHVPPGDTQQLYLDMQKQAVMCVKIPELHLQCTRPIEINHSSSTASKGQQELPDFMRLDYTISDFTFSKVLADLESRNRAEPIKPLLQVVNQKFQDTAAASWDKVTTTVDRVANTVDKMANTVRDALDAFGPHHGKAGQPVLPAALSVTSPLPRESVSYWHRNNDRLVRVQLLVIRSGPRLGPNMAASTSPNLQEARAGGSSGGQEGQRLPAALRPPVRLTSTFLLDAGTAAGAAASSTKEQQIGEQQEIIASNLTQCVLSALEPAAAASIPQDIMDTSDVAPAPAGQEVASLASPITTAITDIEKASGSVTPCLHQSTVPVASAEQPVASSPAVAAASSSTVIAQSEATSSSLALQPALSVLKVLNLLKGSLTGKSAGKDLQGQDVLMTSSAAPPHVNEYVRVSLSYRPAEKAFSEVSTVLQTSRRRHRNMDMSGIRPAGRELANESAGPPSLPTSRPRSSCETPGPIMADIAAMAFPVVRLHLHVVPATSSSQEGVRVQLVVSSLSTEPRLNVPCDGMHLATCNYGGPAVAGTTAWMSSMAANRALEQQSMAVRVVPRHDGAKVSSGLSTVGVPPSVTEGRMPNLSSPVCLAANSNLFDEHLASPHTPEDSNGTKGSGVPRLNLRSTGSTCETSRASPASAVVQRSRPGSLIPLPDTSPPTWQPPQGARLVSVPRQPTSHMEAVLARNVATVSTLVLGASSGGTSSVSVSTGPEGTDNLHPQTSMDVTVQRFDTPWSENAAFKYGSSVSTASGSELPTRVQLGELRHLDGPSKVLVPAWAPGDMRRQSTSGLQAPDPVPAGSLSVESDKSRPILHLGSQAAISEQLSSAQMLLESPPAKLSEGYVQLELFNATTSSMPECASRSGRRSATLYMSLALRRVPSKSPRSAGSLGSSTKGSYRGGRRGSAPLNLARSVEESSPAAQLIEQNISASLETSPTVSGSRNLSVRRAEGDLPAISEAANPDIVHGINFVSSLKVSEGPTDAKESLGRRWTADDLGDNATGYEDFGISSGTIQAAEPSAGLSPGDRKVHSDKRFGDRVYGWRFRHARERVLGRLQHASLGGVGKRALMQPSYRAVLRTEGRIATNPMVLAKSAMQVVPRLPSIARNMGGKIVDGGQQVIQGVPHVASMVADTIIAGGQGVKEKVVESTEQAIKIAKPKIKKGLMALAWKATEAMRKRKQGADGLAIYDNMKPPLRSKHKNGQEHAPKVLMLSLSNSLATKEDEYVCHLTLYAPYWVDNRTGLCLMFKDLDAPAGLDNLPFLIWHPVRVPGDKSGSLSHQSSRERTSSGASTPQLDRRSVQALLLSKARRDGHGFQGQKPALLNDQPRTRFRVDDHGHAKTDFCIAFTIATINQKYSLDIKGEKEKVSILTQDKVNGAESPSTFSQRSSAHNRVTLQVSSTCDGALQQEFGQAATDSWPQPQFSLPPSDTLSASYPCLKSGAEPGPQSELIDVHNQGMDQSSILNGLSKCRPSVSVVVPQIEEDEAYASSHAGDAVTAAVANEPMTCPEPSGVGLGASLLDSTQGNDVNQKPRMPEITPAEDDNDKGLQVTSNVSNKPLPDIPEHGAFGVEMPCLLSPCTSNKDTMGLEGHTSLKKLKGSTPSVAASGNWLSSACDNVEADVKGKKRFPRQGSSVSQDVDHDQRSCKQSQQVYVRRLYQFAVEVWAAPTDTPFGRTKVITVKNKYLILNATGLLIEYKQKGTPDLSTNPNQGKYGETRRFSRRLPNNSSASWHWDNADAEQELMIRPAADDWQWSGSFKLPEVEDYFGLRIRHHRRNEYIIIPVNITVGAAGSVLVTLNSKGSIPPYMIVNRCRDVIIRLKQADYCGSLNTTSNCYNHWEEWDEILPNTNPMPFAWDEPRLRHVVKVVAYIRRDAAAPSPGDAIDVDLDAVDANRFIYVQSRSARTLSLSTQAARAKFLTDNAKKVYVTVYADGPTRVLCFSEDRSGAANLDDEDSLLNLSYRLQRVASRLKDVDRRLVHQLGGALDFDIGVEQVAGQDGSSSHQALASGLLSDGTRRPLRAGILLGPPRGIGAGVSAFRFGALQAAAPISGGTTTSPPSQLGITSLGVPRPLPSFANTRPPSRAGSASTPLALQAPFRNTLASIPALTNLPQRLQHGRTHLNQTHAAGLALVAPGLPPSVDGIPPLFRTAPVAEDMPTQNLEALPTFGGNIDIPIGGDLTVVFRSVQVLSTGLNSNEKVVAVGAQMAVVASTPGNSDANASWTQPLDQPASGLAPAIGSVGRMSAISGSGSGCVCNIALLDHTQIFRDVAASSELRIDFYIAKGTDQPQVGFNVGQGAMHGMEFTRRQRTQAVGSLHGQGSSNAAASVSGGQFAGCVRIPLMSTLGRDKAQVWKLPLERRAGSQLVRGYVSLSFEWSMTNEGMLVHEISTLERILDEKLEMLAQLKPLPISATMSFMRDPAQQDGPGSHELGIAASDSSAPAATMPADSRSLSLGAGGAALSTSRPLPAVKTAKALAESYYVNLEVSVLEISGLVPREGLRASIAASMYGRQTPSTMSIAMLPKALVVMTCNGEPRKVEATANSVNPRFNKNKNTFENVPLGSKMELKVFDQVSKSYLKLLAEAEIHLSRIPGTDPIYAWFALARRTHGSRSQRVLALLMSMEEEGDSGVQLLMRIRINKPQVHGIGMAVTLDLAGIGLCAKTNLEELFNYTMQKIRAMLVQTRSDLQVSLVVQTVQLDNQMLEAKNPVVLSPADVSGSSSLAQARRRHMAEFAKRLGRTNPILRMGIQDSSSRDPLLTCQVIYNQTGSNHAMVSTKGQEDSVGILAFRKVVLQLGPMDFSADQEFIEGVIAYLNGLPLEDFYQDRQWQLKIDVMQGGSMAPIGAAEDFMARQTKYSEDVFAWLAAKEAKEFELLRGQSSMWFYLEEFYLSDVFINVTLALSSSFNTSGSAFSSTSEPGREDDRQRSMLRGFLSRVSGSNGFQLINVTNAPIQLEYVELKNHLVNRVSLINKLYRHYSWIALAQARKVLGGAGPAIAAIPASLLWASIALVDLGQEVAAKRVNPLVVPTRIGYVVFTLMGQVIGVLSRTMCALMGVMPPRFSSDNVNLSDSEMARRFGIKPQTAVDALYLGQRDAVLGLMSAAFGVIHDTAAGARWKGGLVMLGVPMGLIKASVGLGVRPAAGAVEATSKVLQGVGLACLGKRGIQGKLVRRVQAPGLAITDVVQAARASAAQAAIQGALIAAWQAALPAISSSLTDDEVLDVVAARSSRVVLLTNKHLAYLYARRQSVPAPGSSSSTSLDAKPDAFSVTYRVKWIIRNDHIDNIRGLDRGYAVSVEYHKPVKLGRLSLKLPLHRGMRTATAEGHKDLIFRLNRHIGRAANGGGFISPMAAVARERGGFVDIDVS